MDDQDPEEPRGNDNSNEEYASNIAEDKEEIPGDVSERIDPAQKWNLHNFDGCLVVGTTRGNCCDCLSWNRTLSHAFPLLLGRPRWKTAFGR